MSPRPTPIANGTVAARLKAFQNEYSERRPASSASVFTPKFARPVDDIRLPRRQRAVSSYIAPPKPFTNHNAEQDTYKQCGLAEAPRPSLVNGAEQEILSKSFHDIESTRQTLHEDGQPAVHNRNAVSGNLHHVKEKSGSTFDGTADLASVISSLRSTTKASRAAQHKPEQDEHMLHELDTLLQDAIDEHASSSKEPDTGSAAPKVHASAPGTMHHSFSLSHETHFANPFRPPTRDSTNVGSKELGEPNLTNRVSPARQPMTGAYTQENSPTMTPPKTSSLPQLTEVESTEQQVFLPGGHIDRQVTDQNFKAEVTTRMPPRRTQKHSLFSRYPTSPVKQRAVLWEALHQEPPNLDPMCQAPHSKDPIVQGTRVQEPGMAFKKPAMPARQIVHRASSPGLSELKSSLIPLKLPSIVRQRNLSNAGSDGRRSEDSDRFSTARQSHGDLSGISASVHQLDHEHEGSLPESTILVPTAANMSPAVPVQGHEDPARSRLYAQEITGTTRPSMVRSKIQELMAAVQRSGTTTPPIARTPVGGGLVKQSSLREGVQEKGSVPSKNLAPLQLPIGVEASLYTEEPTNGVPSIMKSTSDNMDTLATTTPLPGGSSPSRPAPATPLRGRTRNMRHSVSSHGSPYAIEQRFNLSPTRSMSRGSRRVVRLNVEIRSSPERSLEGNDNHILILRAGIDSESEEE